jgi:hypothetical protein
VRALVAGPLVACAGLVDFNLHIPSNALIFLILASLVTTKTSEACTSRPNPPPCLQGARQRRAASNSLPSRIYPPSSLLTFRASFHGRRMMLRMESRNEPSHYLASAG